jgi:energy-coupling factor transporter ATP-binding protein EcfA2
MFVYLLPFIPWILAFILLLIYKKKIDEATYWGIFAIFISIFLFFLSNPELFKNSVSREIIFIIGIIILFWVYYLGRKAKSSIILSLKTLGLLPIEEYLKKYKENKPHFFRFEGPLWIDFEKGYIVEREETEEILNKLEKEQVFITGEPGSGKSTILGIVGYKLRNKNKPVFILPFKEISKIEKKDEIIKNLEKINGYLFLDDVHLNKEAGKYFKNNMKRRILFSGRKPTEKEERMDEIDQKLKAGIEIKPDRDTKRKIIERFKEITKCSFSKEIEDALLKMGNLMLLSFQLEAHINDREIKELKPIHSQVKDYIEEVKKSIPEADEIFLPIALFYQFEIAIRKDFLKSELGIKEEAISKMVEKREISEIEINNRKYLSLYHSKVAEVFFQTYIEFDDLGSLTKKKITNRQ